MLVILDYIVRASIRSNSKIPSPVKFGVTATRVKFKLIKMETCMPPKMPYRPIKFKMSLKRVTANSSVVQQVRKTTRIPNLK